MCGVLNSPRCRSLGTRLILRPIVEAEQSYVTSLREIFFKYIDIYIICLSSSKHIRTLEMILKKHLNTLILKYLTNCMFFIHVKVSLS